MKASSLGLGALPAAVLLHSGGATSIEATVARAIKEAVLSMSLCHPYSTARYWISKRGR